MRDYQIISADSHVNPPPTFWRDYLPEQCNAVAPTVESTDEGGFILFEGRKTPLIMLSALAGKGQGAPGFGRSPRWVQDSNGDEIHHPRPHVGAQSCC